VALTVDVPDENGLGCEFPGVDRGLRVQRPQSTLQLPDGDRAMVDEGLRERRKDAVIDRVHHQCRPC
jgi:hypothetical protein